jgi:hypothetical protein
MERPHLTGDDTDLRSFEYAPALLARLKTQFPKSCSSCGRTFSTFEEYIEVTTAIGSPQDMDASRRISDPSPPLGVLWYANCRCGSTLTLSCDLPAEVQDGLRRAIAPDAAEMNIRSSRVWLLLRNRVLSLVDEG